MTSWGETRHMVVCRVIYIENPQLVSVFKFSLSLIYHIIEILVCGELNSSWVITSRQSILSIVPENKHLHMVYYDSLPNSNIHFHLGLLNFILRMTTDSPSILFFNYFILT